MFKINTADLNFKAKSSQKNKEKKSHDRCENVKVV